MSTDKRVPARSDAELRRIAERTKAEFGISRRRPVNIVRCLESTSVLTLYGRKELIFHVVDDSELGDADAKTEFSKGVVTITCKRSVRERAIMGVGRDRMTLAHELAHAVLHHSVPMFRLVGAAGATDLAQNAAHTSAEHQAKVFAAAFLIHDEHAAKMLGAVQISEQFGVSLRAAEICFDRLRRDAKRQRSAERVRKSADEAISVLKGKSKAQSQRTYLAEPCTSCHATALIPLGIKVLCDNCGFVGDRFQDGDK
jgi:IrrE N-terminal-like domain